jgi:hypothetical protein
LRNVLLIAISALSYCNAQTNHTWTGLINTDFNTGLNWNTVSVPASTDNVIFNSGSQNCVFGSGRRVNDITITSGYSGVLITSGNTTITGNYSQAGGTFSASSANVDMMGNFSRTGGTFTHNSGKVTFLVPSGSTTSISGAVSFHSLSVNATASGASQRNLTFGGQTTSTLILAGGSSPFAYQGSVNVTSALRIDGTDASTPANNTGTIILNGSSAAVISTAGEGENKLGNLTINTAGAFAMSGWVNVTGTWQNTQAGSFTSGTSTVNFLGAAATVITGTTSTTRASFDNVLVTGTLTLSGTSQIGIGRDLTDNGTLVTNTGLIRLNGTTSQAITGSSTLTTIRALEVANSGTKSLSHLVVITDSVKVSAGTLSTGGNLKLVASASLKGRIAEITGGGAISGNVVAETYAEGGDTDWSVLGPSGVSGLAVSDWESQFPMTCSLCPNGPTSAGGYFVSIHSHDETAVSGSSLAYVEQTYTSALVPGKGYWVYLGNAMSTTSPITWSVSGPAVTGNQSLTLTFSGGTNGNGFNLISNPYASPISWFKLRNSNSSVANAIYIYNADEGTTTSYVNGSSSHSGTATANDVIAAGQGFYVQCTAAATLVAQESNKVSYNTSANPLIRSGAKQEYVRLGLKCFDGTRDMTVVRVENSCTCGFDTEWDALKMVGSPGYAGTGGVWNSRSSIATRAGDTDLSVNSVPLATDANRSIPLSLQMPKAGGYTISAVDISETGPSLCAIIEDKQSAVYWDLRSGPFTFTGNKGSDTARFVLHLCADRFTVGIKKTVPQMFSVEPTYAGVRIITNREMNASKVEVTDLTGRTITAARVSDSGPTDLALPREPALYMVTVTSNGAGTTQKYYFSGRQSE